MAQTYSGVDIFITIGGVTYTAADLSLIKLEVTDSDEGDNEIELECQDNDYKIADSPVIKVGALLSVKWGYVNGISSKQRSNYVLMKPSVKYDKEGVTTTIKAYTKSATLAATRVRTTYGPTSVRQVVSEIANRNGLTLDIKGGNEKMDAFASANWTDRQTLRVLADRYGYQLSYSSDTITFAPVDFGAVPTLELVFANGESGNIISADLNVDARKPKGDSATTATGVNPLTKSTEKAVAADADKTIAISAEDGNSWVSNAVQAVVPSTPVYEFDKNAATPPADIMQYISSPDIKNLLSTATGEKLKKQKKKGELSIVSVGFPEGASRIIVRVRGLSKRDSGNWYVQSVRHSIATTEGYNCHWELSRHGNNTQGGEPNKSKLNNQKPPTVTGDTMVNISAETGKVTP